MYRGEVWVRVATKRAESGKVVFSNEMDPKVVSVNCARWFPEKGPKDLYGWRDSNINIPNDDSPPYGRELGTTNPRGILFKIGRDRLDA